LNYYYDILNAQQQRVGVLILKTTKDLFVVWHLFGIARSLIHSFLKDYSREKNDYDRKLYLYITIKLI